MATSRSRKPAWMRAQRSHGTVWCAHCQADHGAAFRCRRTAPKIVQRWPHRMARFAALALAARVVTLIQTAEGVAA